MVKNNLLALLLFGDIKRESRKDGPWKNKLKEKME